MTAILLVWFVVYSFAIPKTRGDEPHYLTVAESIIRDRDLQLNNNYEERHYAQFYNGKLGPHIASSEDEEWYSAHNLLPSLIALPGYFVGGLTGARVMFVFLFLVQVLLLHLTLKNKFGKTRFTDILTVGFIITPIVFVYSTIIGADLYIGTALLAVYYYLQKESLSKRDYFILGLLASLTIWSHFKAIVIFPSIVILLAAKARHSRQNYSGVIIVSLLLGLSTVALLLFNNETIGKLSLTVTQTAGGAKTLEYPIIGVFISSFDQNFGLMINGIPLLFGMFAFLDPKVIKNNKWEVLCAFLLAGPLIFLNTSYYDWSAGWSAWGRYWVEVAPILFFMFALFVRERKSKLLLIALVCLFGFYFIYDAITALANFGYYTREIYYNLLLYSFDLVFDIPLHKIFPQFRGRELEISEHLKAVFWLLTYGISYLLFIRQSNSLNKNDLSLAQGYRPCYN